MDGDDSWQSQSPNQSSNTSSDDEMNNLLREKTRKTPMMDHYFQHLHLRAICHYGNDINDMWRCIGVALRISSVLSSQNLTCAIECWDMNDGHIILIEVVESLPLWVDDDVFQGEVGGPNGCRNRCWIANGQVYLTPPSMDVSFCNSQIV